MQKKTRREHARIVSEFIDLHRATSKEWVSINKSIKSNLINKTDLYNDKNYQQLVKDTLYKNALAKNIYNNMDRYQESLDRNNIPKQVIEKSAKQFEALRSPEVREAAEKMKKRVAEIDKQVTSKMAKNKEKEQDIER